MRKIKAIRFNNNNNWFTVKFRDLLEKFTIEEIQNIINCENVSKDSTLLLTRHEMKQLTELWRHK